MTNQAGQANVYIQKILLNGKPYLKNFITHQDIVAGGTLEFFMGSTPNKKMATYEKPKYVYRVTNSYPRSPVIPAEAGTPSVYQYLRRSF